MRNFVIILILAVAPLGMQAQTKGEKLHDKYANQEGFTTFSFSGSFLNDLDINVDNDDEDDEMEKRITGDVHVVKLLTYKYEDEAYEKVPFYKIARNQLTGSGYQQVLKEKDTDENFEFFAHGKGKRFSEFHVLHSNENRTTLLSFFGNFKVDELEALSEIGMEKVED